MRPFVKYKAYPTFSKEQTGDIIAFTQCEEGNLISETHDDEESGEKSNEDSLMPPLISIEEMDTMDPGDEYENATIPT